MSILKLIVIFQLLLAVTCLMLQFYALVSEKWGLFESRVELGLVEEHGHYGLWLICTNKFIPAEVDEDGRIIQDVHDCDPMNTFFKPTHSRAFIAIFSICHTVALLAYIILSGLKLVDLFLRKSNKSPDSGDIEINQNQTKRMLIIASRMLISGDSSLTTEEQTKQQIKIKLYTISVAATATSLALLSAIAPRRPLRETDLFQINNVSANNYRTWRGPGFWAQLTTLIMDMLITSLIAIEVRVIFILQQHQAITTSCSTNDSRRINRINNHNNNTNNTRTNNRIEVNEDEQDNDDDNDIIVNPFLSVHSSTTIVHHSNIISGSTPRNNHHRHRNQHHNPSHLHSISVPADPMISMQITRPKTLMAGGGGGASSSSESPSASKVNTDHYVNSNEVRKLKKIMHQQRTQIRNESNCDEGGTTAYCNPMFSEDDNHDDDEDKTKKNQQVKIIDNCVCSIGNNSHCSKC